MHVTSQNHDRKKLSTSSLCVLVIHFQTLVNSVLKRVTCTKAGGMKEGTGYVCLGTMRGNFSVLTALSFKILII